jgi:hypothetical protein
MTDDPYRYPGTTVYVIGWKSKIRRNSHRPLVPTSLAAYADLSALLAAKRTRDYQVESRELRDAGRNSADAHLAGDHKDGWGRSPCWQ